MQLSVTRGGVLLKCALVVVLSVFLCSWRCAGPLLVRALVLLDPALAALAGTVLDIRT